MDKATRSAIAGATQRARRLLEQEILSQLEGTFDILQSGAIGPTGGLHLSERQRFDREKIVAAIDHKRAAGMLPQAAVGDYVRDAAFTTLNRFVALNMLEARELVQECVSKGEQSSGYREFCGMAPGLALLPDSAGYRLYLEGLFDELSTEVKVLFDRRDLASIIWPRRAAFEALLSVLNAPELAGVWAEDETLGWVYQYFNSRADIDDARYDNKGRSKAPQNARELAVRNQFFTPRYVVQFLTDNTLARIWYEMRGGETKLIEQCEYLVRRPVETSKPRAKKDPRDLKILDPACGSGHFLLYSFDLLLVIYEEGWEDPAAPPSALTGRTLRQDHPNLEALRSALPALILRYNLHGIDIDSRCAQIAQLSLWMRTQRAFRDYGITRSDRPPIRRANIVIAEPMPGEKDLVEEFLRGLKEDGLEGLLRRALDIPSDRIVRATKAMADSLAKLIAAVWDSMRLAGEMGALLKIDRALESAIESGRAEWEHRLPLFGVAEYGLEQGRVAPVKETYVRVVPGEQDDFWSKAEKLVFQALADYADSAKGSDSTRRRLFADDAARGFAFADLIAKRFDLVLMNPPFGAGCAAAKTEFDRAYPRTKNDVYAAFVEHGIELLAPGGYLGAITSRTGFFLSSFQRWREEILLIEAPPRVFGDLGYGVLDDAMVEVAAYCIEKGAAGDGVETIFLRALEAGDKAKALSAAIRARTATLGRQRFEVDVARFVAIPGSPFAYWMSERLRELFTELPSFGSDDRTAVVGLKTSEDFRFVRLHWEIPPASKGRGHRWLPFAKGGEFSPFYVSIPTVVDWLKDGSQLWAFYEANQSRTGGMIKNPTFYFHPGITWILRAHKFAPQPLPRDCIFSLRSYCAFTPVDDLLVTLAVFNGAVFDYLFKSKLGRFGHPEFIVGALLALPWAVPQGFMRSRLEALARRVWYLRRELTTRSEISHAFTLPWQLQAKGDSLTTRFNTWMEQRHAVGSELAMLPSRALKQNVNAVILKPARWWRSHPWRRVCANWHIRYHGDAGIYRKATAKARRPSPAGTRQLSREVASDRSTDVADRRA